MAGNILDNQKYEKTRRFRKKYGRVWKGCRRVLSDWDTLNYSQGSDHHFQVSGYDQCPTSKKYQKVNFPARNMVVFENTK